MDYKQFLKTTLPYLGLRWRHFRGKNMRRRIGERLEELGFRSLSEYRSYLLENAEEQRQLCGRLTVTISRFWRNPYVFEALEKSWLPGIVRRLAAGEPLHMWSAGCASGEEPYSLLVLWEKSFASVEHELRLLATDADKRCLERARQGCYPASSFKEMPQWLRDHYLINVNGRFCVPPGFKDRVEWAEHDLIWHPTFPGHHVIFCRNLVYTYFVESLQEEITRRFHQALFPGGLLIVGRKDRLPAGSNGLFRQADHPIYERVGKE